MLIKAGARKNKPRKAPAVKVAAEKAPRQMNTNIDEVKAILKLTSLPEKDRISLALRVLN
jgi:hypothetical protein